MSPLQDRIRHCCLTGLTSLALSCPAIGAPAIEDFQPIVGVSAEPVQTGAGLRGPQELEAFLDGVMGPTLSEMHMAGAVVAVVKDGKPYLIKGYGYADVDRQIPVDGTTTLFRVASLSKLFTWTAVMQLVEQGKINLDADVNNYLTQFKIPATFSQPITMRNLMTHSSGVENGWKGYLFASNSDELLPLAKAVGDHIPGRVRPPPVDLNNTMAASYTNWNAALAGLIVANVSGMSFEEYIEKNIFKPLGMVNSTFRQPLPPALKGQMSNGYTFQQGIYTAQPFDIFNFVPAGALSISAGDFARFMIAHLNAGTYGDARILKVDTAQLMHSRQLAASPYVNGWCLGFYEKHVNGRRIIAHGGGLQWFGSDVNLLPEENIGIFVSYNSASDIPISAREELLTAFMNRYFPAHLPRIEQRRENVGVAARYAGLYNTNQRNYSKNEKVLSFWGTPLSVTSTADNDLLIGGGPTAIRAIEVKKDVFRAMDRDITIAFATNAEGRVQYNYLPQASFYRLFWFETPQFQHSLVGFELVCFLAAIITAVLNWRRDLSARVWTRWARPMAGSLGFINVLFLILMHRTLALADGSDVADGWPNIFHLALILPLLALPVTASVIAFAATTWVSNDWKLWERIQYAVVAAGSVAFLWSLNYWNLIGFKFG